MRTVLLTGRQRADLMVAQTSGNPVLERNLCGPLWVQEPASHNALGNPPVMGAIGRWHLPQNAKQSFVDLGGEPVGPFAPGKKSALV
jgi:hypothetical protein